MLFKRSAVDAYTNGYIPSLASVCHSLYSIVVTDITRIDSNLVNSVFGATQGYFIVKMYIRDNRNIDSRLLDGKHGIRRLHGRHCDSYNITACGVKSADLLNGSRYILRIGISH